VVEQEYLSVVVLYRLVLECRHIILYEAFANRVPKTVNCYKCKKKKVKMKHLVMRLFKKKK